MEAGSARAPPFEPAKRQRLLVGVQGGSPGTSVPLADAALSNRRRRG
jgi:hypothetical protein